MFVMEKKTMMRTGLKMSDEKGSKVIASESFSIPSEKIGFGGEGGHLFKGKKPNPSKVELILSEEFEGDYYGNPIGDPYYLIDMTGGGSPYMFDELSEAREYYNKCVSAFKEGRYRFSALITYNVFPHVT